MTVTHELPGRDQPGEQADQFVRRPKKDAKLARIRKLLAILRLFFPDSRSGWSR